MAAKNYNIEEVKELWKQEPDDKRIFRAATEDIDEYPPEVQTIIKEEAERRREAQLEEKGLPIQWLNFYVNVRIPLGIVVSVIGLIVFALSANDPIAVIVTLILTAFDICLSIFLFIGLRRRRLWGWRLNWVVLVLEVLLRPLDEADDLTMYVVFLVAAALFWLLPNTIYFKKRRYLFT